MKREIKFRAWDKLSQKMCLVDSIEFRDFIEGRTGANVYTIENKIKDSRWLEDGNFELMLHIGVKDAAGVEIYDGDVIKGQRDDVHIIEWEEKEARYVAVCGSIRCGVLQEWVTGYDKKVIGNIHQNPELLK